jgi:hypothetical protein
MKKNQTQMSFIRAVLKTDKKITRNYCLNKRPMISRLGSLIKFLQYDGWKFEKGYTRDRKDYEYRLIKIGK